MKVALTIMIQKEVDLPDIDEDYEGYERAKNEVISEIEELGYDVSIESEEPVEGD
jgi:predicted amino acid-binding ACT domain protein